jgi:hypothetical protein
MAQENTNYSFDFMKPVTSPDKKEDENRKYLAFDIEIAQLVPEDDANWKAHRPLGISCAATLTSSGELLVWHGKTASGAIGDRMSIPENKEMVAYLQRMTQEGYTILTWNGLGFDFDILAEESGELEACKELAWNHVDIMFHVFCLKGYGLALNKAAKGMGLAGKTPGMQGDLAPIYWAEGKKQEVLEYVSQDVRTTLELAEAIDRRHELRWTSDSGKPQALPFSDGLLRVREAITLPKADTSWMKNPWPRSKFTGWMGMK